jgi:hypothetical protein
MTYNDPPNLNRRGSSDDTSPDRSNRGRATVWGVLAVLALVIVAWFMFYDTGRSKGTQTVSSTPRVTQTGPTTGSGPGMTTNPPAAPR